MSMQQVEIPKSFKDSVITIVRSGGRRGQAVENLEKFHDTVKADYERAAAQGSEAASLLKAEMHFIEGFLEGPGAVHHDIHHIKKVKPL